MECEVLKSNIDDKFHGFQSDIYIVKTWLILVMSHYVNFNE